MTRLVVYVYTEELEKLRAFYEAALGVKPQHDENDDVWQPFQLAAGAFALHAKGVHTEAELQGFNVSIEVDDIDAALARCEAHGAKVLQGVADVAFGKQAVIEDPDGRRLFLVQSEMD